MREGEQAYGTEKQDQRDARGPSDPLARHAVQHHDRTSPGYIVRHPVALASDVDAAIVRFYPFLETKAFGRQHTLSLDYGRGN